MLTSMLTLVRARFHANIDLKSKRKTSEQSNPDGQACYKPETLSQRKGHNNETKLANQSGHPTMGHGRCELNENAIVTDFDLWCRDHTEFFECIGMFGIIYRSNQV